MRRDAAMGGLYKERIEKNDTNDLFAVSLTDSVA
jgi:hypothetical protein